jgi:hypothetical protein
LPTICGGLRSRKKGRELATLEIQRHARISQIFRNCLRSRCRAGRFGARSKREFPHSPCEKSPFVWEEKIGNDDLLPWLDNWIEAAQRGLGHLPMKTKPSRRRGERRSAGSRRTREPIVRAHGRVRARGAGRKQSDRRSANIVRLRLLEAAILIDELALDVDAVTQRFA